MDLDSVSVHKHAKKELGQNPAILTSHLVNNPYVIGFIARRDGDQWRWAVARARAVAVAVMVIRRLKVRAMITKITY